MSWQKYFTVLPQSTALQARLNQANLAAQSQVIGGFGNKFSSYLPEIYSGAPNRIERYVMYDQMDSDADVNVALDTLADFCTQLTDKDQLPFHIEYSDDATETEVQILREALREWCNLNEFNRRIWRIVRGTFKYGDQFFIRDPETFKWEWVDPNNVDGVSVNETAGKKPVNYLIRNLDLNLQSLVATSTTAGQNYGSLTTGNPALTSAAGRRGIPFTPTAFGGSSTKGGKVSAYATYEIDARHVVHLSMSEGIDPNWPFGNAILENVFKVYKQLELLRDSALIYRIARAPERRIFYIDVGNMPPHRAMAHVERTKQEIHQRRIPNRTGGGMSIQDAAYSPLCLCFKTTILPLLDGRELTIEQLAEEYKQGKQNWAYSCDPETGRIVPGKISWAGKTREKVQTLKITLDNGEVVIVTPDHQIPVLGKGFVKAQDLTIHDNLISFQVRMKNLDNRKKNKSLYQQIFDHEKNTWLFVHRVVANFFKKIQQHTEFTFLAEYENSSKDTIHHIDFDRDNNMPENLVFMNKTDHIHYHKSIRQEYWDNITPEERARLVENLSTKLKIYWDNMSDDKRQKALESIHNAKEKFLYLLKNDEEFRKKYLKTVGKVRSAYIATHPEFKENLLLNLTEMYKPWPNQKMILTQEMLSRMVRIVKDNGLKNRIKCLEIFDKDEILLDLFRQNNPEDDELISKIDYDKWGYVKVKRILKQFGYKNWKDFIKKIPQYNHNIVKIEWNEELIDVGTVTIDGNEDLHGYHTFAIKQGIFVKNSIMEDYFFPQSSDGRTSKVETLPGGEATGVVEEIVLFQNMLFRGLRIPVSYIPTGPEEGTNVFTDGRVGTAYIQEFRFGEYCQRLQRLIDGPFDKEFKLFVEMRGINIEANVFRLKFNEPESFGKYRQIELNKEYIQLAQGLFDNPYLSKRFILEEYMGLTTEKILRNEMLWRQENPNKTKQTPGELGDQMGLGAIGLRSGGLPPGSGLEGQPGFEPEIPPGTELATPTPPPMQGAPGQPLPPAGGMPGSTQRGF